MNAPTDFHHFTAAGPRVSLEETNTEDAARFQQQLAAGGGSVGALVKTSSVISNHAALACDKETHLANSFPLIRHSYFGLMEGDR